MKIYEGGRNGTYRSIGEVGVLSSIVENIGREGESGV